MDELREKTQGMGRREFLKGAIAGATIGAVTVGGGSAIAWPRTSTQLPGFPTKWDREVDVVVLGSGTASVAALTAHDAGAKVLILEKGEVPGGTTFHSGGALWIPNNYLMRQAGIPDSKSEALTYLRRVAGGQSNEKLMNAFLDNAPQMVEWLRDNAGFQWQPGGWSPTDESVSVFQDYYAEFEGGKKRGRSIGPVPQDGTGGGQALIAYAQKALNVRGIQTLLKTPGKRLITNANGEVVGVIAQSGDKEIAIKARRAVIIGTGGFDHNKEMTAHYLRGPIYRSCSVPTNTGDGHLMGMALGADLRNMNEIWGFPAYAVDPETLSGIEDWGLWRGKPGTIIVNKFGERICNEAAPYDTMLRAFYAYDTGHFDWRNIPSFIIVDSGYAQRYGLPGTYQVGMVPAYMVKADTLGALATALGIDVANLQATVERFNRNARDGVDPDWHRGEFNFDRATAGDPTRSEIKNPSLAPLENPPYYGTAIWPGALSTNGGLKTNENAQVLNVFGAIIPRLYCSGNAMASVAGVGYAGGGATLGPGMTFAYIGGRHAASLKAWE